MTNGEKNHCQHFWSSHSHSKGLVCVSCGIDKPPSCKSCDDWGCEKCRNLPDEIRAKQGVFK